jgi:hypothetical protein
MTHPKQWFTSLLFLVAGLVPAVGGLSQEQPPAGFTAIFNGMDLEGWIGLEHFDPRKLAEMTDEERKAKLAKNLEDLRMHWSVENGELVNDGHGVYATTAKDYGDMELLIDYKTVPLADSGIYLRATPQVQIWDYTEEAKFKLGADKGSGALWNNSAGAGGKDPLVRADKPFGEWNHFRIIQVGERTTVYLNDQLVVDHARMENYYDRTKPLFARGPIQLQTHGGEIRWRKIYLKEIGPEEANQLLASKSDSGFVPVFNGKTFDGWAGPVENYDIKDGVIVCKPDKGGTIYTKDEYSDFVARVEFRLPPGGNNGLAIRYPGEGDTAYVGMCELQVLDDSDTKKYGKLDPRQFHGSAYGMVAAERGYLRRAGQWNFQEVTVQGSTVKVELNGSVILNADLSKVTEYMGNSPHPGKDRTSGHFGFAGHGDAVEFRNVRIRPITAAK